jgi:acetyl esterase/lipase
MDTRSPWTAAGLRADALTSVPFPPFPGGGEGIGNGVDDRHFDGISSTVPGLNPATLMSLSKIRLVLTASIPLAAANCLPGGESYDLNRVTPVPATEPVPVVDFFRPRSLQEPKLNLSGTHIAAIITANEDRHELLVYDRETQKTERVGGVGDKDVNQFYWLNNRRLVFELSARKLYGLGLFAADVGKTSEAYPLLQYYGSRMVAIPTQNRLEPLVWNSHDGLETHRDLGVAVINTAISTGRFINRLSAGTTRSDRMDARDNNEKHIIDRYPVAEPGIGHRYIADKEGRLGFAITMLDGLPMLHRLDGRRWEKCPVDLEDIEIIGCGDEPGQLVVRGPRQSGKPRALQFMDGGTGRLGDVLLQDDAYDFYGNNLSEGWLYRDPVSHRIIGVVYERNGPDVVWFTETYRKLQKVLDGFFPGLVVRILGSDEAQKVFLVATFSDRQPVLYSWVDLEKRTAGLFKSSAPWIDPKRMQPMNVTKFKTRDGRRLDAYLTLPAGASKQNPPPMIVLVHGGPWARDSWGFDGEVQFLASRGYAVLQPNFRGSNGYAWMFPEEDKWDFRKMHDDVTDATRAMIAAGLVDGSRVAVMGTSFGGYLALSGVVNEPDLYRCAVTIAGVSDWEQQIKDKKYDQYDSWVYGYYMRKLGDPGKQPEKFDAISPGRHVDRIRVPVFVAHGGDDPRVEIGQARRLISELEKNHVPHESLLVGEEGHGMRHLENEVELFTRIEAFLAKNLGPAAPAVAPAGAR